MKQHQEGFTLLELVVVMFCTTLVIGAAMTVLFTGLRVEKSTQEGLSTQQTAHTVLTLVEHLTSDGKVETVEAVGDTDWILRGQDDAVLLVYNSGPGTIDAGGAVLMENVSSASAEISEDNLLTLCLESNGESYEISSFCRTDMQSSALNDRDSVMDQAESLTTGDEPGRAALLFTLATQYGSDGRVLDDHGLPNGQYFSEWYIGDYESNPGWNKDTPWCACFLSWGLDKIQQQAVEDGNTYLDDTLPKFANVDTWMEDFQQKEEPRWMDGSYVPSPGDLVFFDWSGGDDPEHVGAVFHVDEDKGVFYTIEGNSNGKVCLHVYSLGSKVVVGYGILEWKQQE